MAFILPQYGSNNSTFMVALLFDMADSLLKIFAFSCIQKQLYRKIGKTWPQKSPNVAPIKSQLFKINSLLLFGLLDSSVKFEPFHVSKSKDAIKLAKTWLQYSQKIALIWNQVFNIKRVFPYLAWLALHCKFEAFQSSGCKDIV